MKRIGELLLRVVFVLLLPVLVLVAAVAGVLSKPVQRTRSEVADILERYASHRVDEAVWDDFTCIPIADLELENVRRRVVDAEEEAQLHPHVLESLIHQLRRA